MGLTSRFRVVKDKWRSDWRKIKTGQQKLRDLWRDQSYERLMELFWYKTESEAQAVSKEMEDLHAIIEELQRDVR